VRSKVDMKMTKVGLIYRVVPERLTETKLQYDNEVEMTTVTTLEE